MKKLRLSITTFSSIVIFLASGSLLHAQSRVSGVSTKNALLHQIQLGLNINLSKYTLSASLLSKLPTTNNLSSITSSFQSAWTQLTFSVCSEAISKGEIPTNLSTASAIKAWLRNLATKTWAVTPGDSDIENSYQAGFSTVSVSVSAKNKMALSCSHILSSPNLYTILE